MLDQSQLSQNVNSRGRPRLIVAAFLFLAFNKANHAKTASALHLRCASPHCWYRVSVAHLELSLERWISWDKFACIRPALAWLNEVEAIGRLAWQVLPGKLHFTRVSLLVGSGVSHGSSPTASSTV